MAEDHATWFARWSQEMASGAPAPGGGWVDVGPVEALTSKPGHQTPTRNKQRSRVPPYSAGQQKKLQDVAGVRPTLTWRLGSRALATRCRDRGGTAWGGDPTRWRGSGSATSQAPSSRRGCRTQDLEPVAAPAEEVAVRLGVTVEAVHAAGVEPYYTVAGKPVLSIHLTAVALGLRRSRLEKGRQRDGRRRRERLPVDEAS